MQGARALQHTRLVHSLEQPRAVLPLGRGVTREQHSKEGRDWAKDYDGLGGAETDIGHWVAAPKKGDEGVTTRLKRADFERAMLLRGVRLQSEATARPQKVGIQGCENHPESSCFTVKGPNIFTTIGT